MTDVIAISLLLGWNQSYPSRYGCGTRLRAAVAVWSAEGTHATLLETPQA